MNDKYVVAVKVKNKVEMFGFDLRKNQKDFCDDLRREGYEYLQSTGKVRAKPGKPHRTQRARKSKD